jgi:hypothetical protein
MCLSTGVDKIHTAAFCLDAYTHTQFVRVYFSAGVLCGAAASGNFTWTLENVGKSLVCMIMSGPFLTGYTQTINDYYDREMDAINEPYRPIPSGLQILPTNPSPLLASCHVDSPHPHSINPPDLFFLVSSHYPTPFHRLVPVAFSNPPLFGPLALCSSPQVGRREMRKDETEELHPQHPSHIQGLSSPLALQLPPPSAH